VSRSQVNSLFNADVPAVSVTPFRRFLSLVFMA
jgi:hypothetical protein